jgi:glutamate-1-semialdehyde 2,1-aminomutase
MVSEKVVQMVPCVDLVRFSNSGTEALHFVLRLARAYTGREKVIKFEGHYHGWSDEMSVSIKPSPPMGLRNAPWRMRELAGQPENIVDNIIILPWNDLELVERTLKNKGHEIAAIITEPIMFNNGGILPRKGYLEGLRDLATQHGVVLIFDEIVTGFRLALGGAQEYLGVLPDLCVFGKAVGGGYPIAGFGGRREIMNLVANNEVPHMGTYNSNPLCLAAAFATLQELSKNNGKAIRDISEIGARLRTGLNDLFENYGFPARAAGTDPVFTITSPILNLQDYRDYLKLDFDFIHRFHKEMFFEGVWFMGRGNFMVSTAHTKKDIEHTLEVVERVIKKWEKMVLKPGEK